MIKTNMLRYFCAIIFSLCTLFTFKVNASCIPESPNPPRLVNDFAGILSASEISNLESKAVAFNDSTSSQIAVVILNDICDNDPNQFAAELGQQWGIGQQGKNNGIVLLIKVKNGNSKGRIAIQVGYGLEASIPDAISKRIIENEMVPNFKQKQYYKGIDAAIDALMLAGRGQYKADAKPRSKQGSFLVIIIIVVIIIIIASSGRNGRNKHHSMGRSDLPLWMIMGMGAASSGRSGNSNWGNFSSGGGSFGGFGGGSFGGGGASGSW